MILKIKHFDEAVFRGKMEHLKDVPFTLFVDDIPQVQEDLSEINVLVLQEPNEYFGIHDWAIANKHYFSVILTWDEKVLNNCDNAMFLPFGHTWFRKEHYEKTYNKNFQVSHLAGALNKTYGHSLRHELTARENELKIPTNFYKTYGSRSDINDARKGKVEVFGGSQFGVAIENTNHRGYFTEKILDLFLLKTIPIYWGCSNIGDFFNKDGIIQVQNVDDIITKSHLIIEDFYYLKKDIIEENYQKSLNYVDYEQNIVAIITSLFTENEILAI